MSDTCTHKGWLTPIPDSLCREAWMIGKTVWCQRCGGSWVGSPAEELQALLEESKASAPFRSAS